MTPEISLTLGILLAAVILFISERLRLDIIALLVMVALALTGLVTPSEALSGFSSPAVVTVWAVFVLSGGLSRTGVASLVGRQIVRLAGSGEARLVAVIMLTAAAMSTIMNNVGVVALLLPVVVSIARRTGHHPSRLLMPLAVASLLGGMATLIGTPANILAADALQEIGLAPFHLFDFLPVGGIATAAGTLYIVVAGRRLLKARQAPQDRQARDSTEVHKTYHLDEHLSKLRIPADSPLAGRKLAQTRLSAALGLTVLDVIRERDRHLFPKGRTKLHEGDLLTVAGRLDALDETRGRPYLVIENEDVTGADLVSEDVVLVEVLIPEGSTMVGRTIRQLDFRQRFGGIVLALRRGEDLLTTDFDTITLQAGNQMLVQGRRERIETLRELPDCEVSEPGLPVTPLLDQGLLEVRIPEGSPLVGKTLARSELAELAGLAVLGLVRDGQVHLLVHPRETLLQAEDRLYVKGQARENLEALRALQELIIEEGAAQALGELETEQTGLLEVVVSPHSHIHGQTLAQIEFRSRYDLNVIAIFREGEVLDSDVNNVTLRFGDALLLHGPREKLALVARDPEFISLSDDIQPSPRVDRAPFAVAVMLGVVLAVMFGWLTLPVAGVAGGVLMVLSGCLTMDEAYRDIEWQAVFLIAGMLPLGIALEKTGAAALLAAGVVESIGVLGVLPMIGALFGMTVLASQVIPNAIVVVLMAPISLVAAADAGLSRHAVMMVIALGASSSFLSPVGHPANLLVMAAGGYRFTDFIRVGLPLTIVLAAIALFVLPLIWPF